MLANSSSLYVRAGSAARLKSSEAKRSFTTVSAAGGTVANVSARSAVLSAAPRELRKARLTATNLTAFSSSVPRIFEMDELISPRSDFCSSAESPATAGPMFSGLSMSLPICPRTSASDRLPWGDFSPSAANAASAAHAIIDSIVFFIVTASIVFCTSIPCLRHPDDISCTEYHVLVGAPFLANFIKIDLVPRLVAVLVVILMLVRSAYGFRPPAACSTFVTVMSIVGGMLTGPGEPTSPSTVIVPHGETPRPSYGGNVTVIFGFL